MIKRTILYFSSSLLLISCGLAQKETNGHDDRDAKRKAVLNPECSKYYFFNDEIIDLEILETIDLGGSVLDFKKCSKYAHRFESKIGDTVSIGDLTYILEIDNKKNRYQLICMKGKQINKTVKLPVADPLPEVHEYSASLIPAGDDIIVMMEDWYATKYTLCKFNELGKEMMRKEIEHTYITHPEPNTNHHNRYLYFSELTSSQMIFTSHMAFADKFKTILLDMDDFTVKEYDQMAHGYILDENDEELAGYVTSKKDYDAEKQPVNFEITMIDGKKYEFSIEYGDEACEFLMKDSLLYIGNYHPISTGSSLHCFDMRSGKMKWEANVLQVNASHSEYWNKVTLSLYKDKLIMQGDEAYGSYLQIFESETGERLAHFGNFFEVKK